MANPTSLGVKGGVGSNPPSRQRNCSSEPIYGASGRPWGSLVDLLGRILGDDLYAVVQVTPPADRVAADRGPPPASPDRAAAARPAPRPTIRSARPFAGCRPVAAGWNSQVAKPLRRQCAAGSPDRMSRVSPRSAHSESRRSRGRPTALGRAEVPTTLSASKAYTSLDLTVKFLLWRDHRPSRREVQHQRRHQIPRYARRWHELTRGAPPRRGESGSRCESGTGPPR
jgi:hypothetical protein